MEIISKKEAKEKGLLYYFTGKPCRRGGLGPRYVSTGACRCDLCVSFNNDYFKNNPLTQERKKAHNEASKRYYQRNKEKHSKAVKKWKQNNKEKWNLYNKQWYKDNWKDFYNENRHMYIENARSRKRNLENQTPVWVDRDSIREVYKLASLLKQQTGFDWDVDHIIPLKNSQVSGLHVHDNLQPIPSDLNMKKGNRLVYTEYLSWLDDFNVPIYTPVALEVARDGL